MTENVLILGYGNPGRGDDALGPLLLERLAAEPGDGIRQNAGDVGFITEFQLQIENALDLRERRLVLFVDADVSIEASWRLSRLQAATSFSYSTHAIRPESVMQVYREIHDEPPPPCFLLGIRGYSFELGAELTPEASANLESALALASRLCANPDSGYWLKQCESCQS